MEIFYLFIYFFFFFGVGGGGGSASFTKVHHSWKVTKLIARRALVNLYNLTMILVGLWLYFLHGDKWQKHSIPFNILSCVFSMHMLFQYWHSFRWYLWISNLTELWDLRGLFSTLQTQNMINFLCDFMNDKGLIDKKYLHKHNKKITALWTDNPHPNRENTFRQTGKWDIRYCKIIDFP